MADEKVLGTVTIKVTDKDIGCESDFEDVAQTLFWLEMARETIKRQVLEGN